MRLLLFVLSLVFSSVALSAQPLVGTIERYGSNVYLKSGRQCPRYTIESNSEDATLNIRKLSSGDTLTASGFLNTESCTATVDSVDYVGLKKMLGYWFSSDGLISVSDFNSLSFYPLVLKNFKGSIDYLESRPIKYRYSVTPSGGSEWVVFLSDNKSTSFATIKFFKNTATMKIYDSETGDIKKTLHMSKWGDLN